MFINEQFTNEKLFSENLTFYLVFMKNFSIA